MSTRCQIGFYERKEQAHDDFKALICRHSDGYPGTVDGKQYGVLPVIIPFLRWFAGARGISNPEYVSALLLQYLCNEYDNPLEGGFTGVPGHGICLHIHGDIEYFYKVYPNAVEVYAVGCDNAPEKWTLLQTVGLK